jgi:hypothetical protein
MLPAENMMTQMYRGSWRQSATCVRERGEQPMTLLARNVRPTAAS